MMVTVLPSILPQAIPKDGIGAQNHHSSKNVSSGVFKRSFREYSTSRPEAALV